MGSECCYVECKIGSLNENTERVEIRSNRQASFKKCTPFVVKWNKANEAILHRQCWEQLLKSARTRTKSVDIKLSLDEKQMIKDAAKTAEFHDSKKTFELEAKRIATMLKSATHCVAFTGAGISTSAGIGDYRGKSGKWTLEDQEVTSIKEEESSEPPAKRRKTLDDTNTKEAAEDVDQGVAYEDLRPTYTHEALKKLMDMNILKYIISQNGDGLHGLSGVSTDKLSELHGNVFIEKCEKCGEQYEREFYVMDDHASQYYEELDENGETTIIKPKHAVQCKLCKLCHRTGRKCDRKGCKGYLIDSIINFCDHLDDSILDRAIEEAKQCDLMVCLGTTLTVTPASTIIEMGKHPLRIVICNRQKTHMDKECLQKNPEKKDEALGSRVFGDCDKLMREVMKYLLSGQDLKNWEDEREQRMKIYNSKRIIKL